MALHTNQSHSLDSNAVQTTIQTESQTNVREGNRVFYIDAIRVFMTILVVMHHLALTYMAVIPAWYYLEATTDQTAILWLSRFLSFNQAFFMGVFFLLAGYFTPASYDRKGAGAFLKDRFVRLGIPLLVFAVLINPVITYIGFPSWDMPEVQEALTVPYWILHWFLIGSGPLWFVAALLLFVCVYALVRRFVPVQEQKQVKIGIVPSYYTIILFTLLLAVVTFLVRVWFPLGSFIPVVGFQPPHFAQYISLFIVGCLAYRRDWLRNIPTSMGLVGLVVVLGTTLIKWMLPDFLDEMVRGGWYWQSFVSTLLESMLCVGMCFALPVLFRMYFNQQGRLGTFLSQNAYAVYIIHAPVIVGVAFLFASVDQAPLLKWTITSLISVPLCFLCAALLRMLPGARKVL